MHIHKNSVDLAQSIYIKPEEVELFTLAWENLMATFKIPALHQTTLFECMQGFFTNLDHDSLYIYELNCAIDTVTFLINYLERFEKLQQGKATFEIDEKAKVRFEIAGVEIEVKYPGISQIAFTTLYQHFRSYDNFLRQYLNEYTEPPSLETLNQIKLVLGDQRGDKMQYYVIEHISVLKSFIDERLSKELYKRVNYFIFELLYLFNVIRYAGKVGGKLSEDFALTNSINNTKFNPLLMESKDKSRFVTTIVANAVKVVQREV